MTSQRCASHAMICMRGVYVIPQRHNEIRDLEAKILQTVCTDVEMEPVLQEVTGEVLPSGANMALTHKSGRENNLRSSMLGYATLTQTHTRISPRSRFTSCMRMTQSAFIFGFYYHWRHV